MKVAITGASGMIGTALARLLASEGDEVVRLVRREPAAPDELGWDPAAHRLDPAALSDVDAVVHLAGAGLGDRRWTEDYKRLVRDSRADGTSTIAEALAAAPPRPRVLVSASGVDYYGDTGDRPVDESSPSGSGFLPEVCRVWEAATAAAARAGVRVVRTRSGPVLAAEGGLVGRLLPLARLGILSPVGTGRQYLSWVSLLDEVRAIRFLLRADDIAGPVNLVAPQPVTNAEFMRTWLHVLGRPAVLPKVPGFALRLAIGGFAEEGLLIGQRVVPAVLQRAGYEFAHPTLESALRWATGRRAR